MKNKVFSKIALAFIILTIIAFSVEFAPGVLAAVLAVPALLIAIAVFIVYLCGGLIGLVTWIADGGALLGYVGSFGVSCVKIIVAIFSFLPPIAEFSCAYLSPICAYIGIGFGVVALVFSILALTTAESKAWNVLKFESRKPPKPPKSKLRRTDRGIAVLYIILSSVFIALNVLAFFLMGVLELILITF